MAAKKSSSKTRKVTRAKATKKASVRSGRKAPGLLVPQTGKKLYEIY
jgi:hypothetical protein